MRADAGTRPPDLPQPKSAIVNTFEFYRFRLYFRALGPIRIPPGKAGNVMRGGFGAVLRELTAAEVYHRIFQPRAAPGVDVPSGLGDWPRPFVLRAGQLDGQTLSPGEAFSVDLHIFDTQTPSIEIYRSTLAELARRGLGVGRGPARLEGIEQLDLSDHPQPLTDPPSPSVVSLEPGDEPVNRVLLRFVTPTELKSAGHPAELPDFPVLFGRLRDRLSTLRSLYGYGPLEIDFRATGDRSADIRLLRHRLTWHHVSRKSTRTGQVHALSGFTGDAEYEGPLAEFLPWLRAGRWVGVGRHTVWGQGDLRVL